MPSGNYTKPRLMKREPGNWLSHDYHDSHGCHMTVTWLSHDCHMTVTWLSHDCHDCHMIVTWLSHDTTAYSSASLMLVPSLTEVSKCLMKPLSFTNTSTSSGVICLWLFGQSYCVWVEKKGKEGKEGKEGSGRSREEGEGSIETWNAQCILHLFELVVGDRTVTWSHMTHPPC